MYVLIGDADLCFVDYHMNYQDNVKHTAIFCTYEQNLSAEIEFSLIIDIVEVSHFSPNKHFYDFKAVSVLSGYLNWFKYYGAVRLLVQEFYY
jgi:hypothetical protein